MNPTLFEPLPSDIRGKTFGIDMVHKHEATPEGTVFVQENKARLNAACMTCLKLMCDGVKLSDDFCKEQKITRSISSRISELGKAGIVVSKSWFEKDGEKIYKEYWLSGEEIIRIKTLYNL